jgi:predicted hydrolase (HD superfamily)
MESTLPTREQAWTLLKEFNSTERTLRHALAVEAVMRHGARKRGRDADTWGVVGLIHDLDYERFPDQHCTKTREILAQRGWPEELIRAVVSHGWGTCSDAEPQTEMEKYLFAVDELTGLVSAAALVRPSKSVLDLEVRSVKKKWKEKSFAAGVDRSVIERGAAMLGVTLEDLIAEVIEGMRPVAAEIGLAGAPTSAN